MGGSTGAVSGMRGEDTGRVAPTAARAESCSGGVGQEITSGAAIALTDGVNRRWNQFNRRGPVLMLAVAVVVSGATADLVMTGFERLVALPLAVVLTVLEAWWLRAARSRPEPSPATVFYFAARWALSFVLSWLNPFMGFYAASGYFGTNRLLPERYIRPGLLATAVTVAGAQTGGMPPHGSIGWVVYGILLGANVAMVIVSAQLAAKEAERTRLQTATIQELERANTRLRQALDENAALHDQLLVQAREAGVADERRRLAAEIHDTIAQGLTGIIAQLHVVMGTKDAVVARGHVLQAADLARHSLGEARRSVQNLAPAALEQHGLSEALEKTVDLWAERQSVAATLTVTGTVQPLHDEVEATVLRITQEALSNAARHAGATRVGVTLSFMEDEVTLDVRDDGRGFDPLTLPPRSGTGGFGLDGMRARAERIAGTLTVESEPGQGTAVSARVPLVGHDR